MKKTSSLLRIILGLVAVGVVSFLLTNGIRILNENNSLQRGAQIELEDYINSGEEFPVGKFVSLETRWVIGPFATETSTSSRNGIKATASVEYYYFLVLEDHTIMALKTQNKTEKATLDRMSNWLLSVDGFPTNGETIKLQGKLKTIKDNDLLNLYRSGLASTFALSSDDPAVRYVVLDTTAGREQVYIIIIGITVVLMVVYQVRRKLKNRARREA